MLASADIVFTSVFTAEIVLKVKQTLTDIKCFSFNKRFKSYLLKNTWQSDIMILYLQSNSSFYSIVNVIVGNKNPFSDDNIRCYSSQRLLLPQLFQHLGPSGGQCVSPIDRHGVSGFHKYTA